MGYSGGMNQIDPAATPLPNPTPPRPPVPVERPPAWPTAIGVIAIVFGAAGMLGGVYGLLGTWINPMIADLIDPTQASANPFATGYEGWGVGLSAVALVVAAWLLWGGVALLGREPAGATRLKHWAVAKIVLSLAMAGFQALIMPAVLEASQPSSPQAPHQVAAFSEVLNQVIVASTVAFTVVWGAALPVFVLVWFKRKKITAEVASWNDEPGRD